MEFQVTAFGSAFASPAQTSAVLRARAAAAGLNPTAPDPLDLVVAVVGAQALLSARGATSLAHLNGQAALAALAAVYCRAGGQAGVPVPEDEKEVTARANDLLERLAHASPHPLPQAALASLGQAVEWAQSLSDCDVAIASGQVRSSAWTRGVLVSAAEDLAAGWDDPAIVAVSDALALLASHP